MVQALGRVLQQNVKMEIEIIPTRISFEDQQTFPLRFKLKIERGPETFNTKIYSVKSRNELQVDFKDEIFKRTSSFYFTDKGAEYKKAKLKIIQINDKDKEHELVSETINLSTLISMVPKDLNIELHKNGIEKLEVKCCCRPIGDQKDIEYISQFINLEI